MSYPPWCLFVWANLTFPHRYFVRTVRIAISIFDLPLILLYHLLLVGYVDVDIDGSPAPSDSASNSASPYAYSDSTGPMFNREPNRSPEVAQVMNEGQGVFVKFKDGFFQYFV